MQLKSLTYTSIASFDLDAGQLENVHRTAREFNALDGITGLLVFNGTHFLQIVEGSHRAVDDLVDRLRRDTRHSGVEVRDVRDLQNRNFPDWSMELVQVEGSYLEAKTEVASRLPNGVDGGVRDLLYRMTETISGTVRM